MGLLLALIGIPAVVIALIGEQETRIVVFGLTCIGYWVLWKKIIKDSDSTLMFWICVIALIFVGGSLRSCSSGTSSDSECIDTGRYGEYTVC